MEKSTENMKQFDCENPFPEEAAEERIPGLLDAEWEEVTESRGAVPVVHPLTLEGGWESQVKAKNNAQEEARRKERHDYQVRREAQRREKRASNLMRAIAAALALILAGGVYLNFVDNFPMEISVAVIAAGMALLSFTIGWICGWNKRRDLYHT